MNFKSKWIYFQKAGTFFQPKIVFGRITFNVYERMPKGNTLNLKFFLISVFFLSNDTTMVEMSSMLSSGIHKKWKSIERQNISCGSFYIAVFIFEKEHKTHNILSSHLTGSKFLSLSLIYLNGVLWALSSGFWVLGPVASRFR